jgi:hypothetical protein
MNDAVVSCSHKTKSMCCRDAIWLALLMTGLQVVVFLLVFECGRRSKSVAEVYDKRRSIWPDRVPLPLMRMHWQTWFGEWWRVRLTDPDYVECAKRDAAKYSLEDQEGDAEFRLSGTQKRDRIILAKAEKECWETSPFGKNVALEGNNEADYTVSKLSPDNNSTRIADTTCDVGFHLSGEVQAVQPVADGLVTDEFIEDGILDQPAGEVDPNLHVPPRTMNASLGKHVENFVDQHEVVPRKGAESNDVSLNKTKADEREPLEISNNIMEEYNKNEGEAEEACPLDEVGSTTYNQNISNLPPLQREAYRTEDGAGETSKSTLWTAPFTTIKGSFHSVLQQPWRRMYSDGTISRGVVSSPCPVQRNESPNYIVPRSIEAPERVPTVDAPVGSERAGDWAQAVYDTEVYRHPDWDVRTVKKTSATIMRFFETKVLQLRQSDEKDSSNKPNSLDNSERRFDDETDRKMSDMFVSRKVLRRPLTAEEMELLRCIGLDSFMMLRFLKLGVDMAFWPLIVASVLLVPAYKFSGKESRGFYSGTVVNLHRHDYLHWLLVVYGFILFLYFLRRLWIEWEIFQPLRHDFLENGDFLQPRFQNQFRKTCLIEYVPHKLKHDQVSAFAASSTTLIPQSDVLCSILIVIVRFS